jgi:hypothetical protein
MNLRRFTLFALAVLLLPVVAEAQNDILRDLERDAATASSRGLGSSVGAASVATGQNGDDDIDEFGVTDPDAESDTPMDAEEKQRLEARAFGAGDKLFDINTVTPSKLIPEVLDSNSYNTMMSNNISKKGTIYLTTVNMVEPAVAAALGTSVQTGLSYYEQLMSAEENLRTQLAQVPELRDWLLQWYSTCVNRRLAAGAGNRITAQELCLDPTSDTGFKPSDSPDHPNGLDGASVYTSVPDAEKDNYIGLTDILFNQAIAYFDDAEGRANEDEFLAGAGSNTARQNNLIALKESFARNFGDYLIRFNLKDGVTSSFSGAGGAAATAKSALRMVRVPPKKSASIELQQLTDSTYDALMAINNRRCWAQKNGGLVGCDSSASGSAFQLGKCSRYWASAVEPELIDAVTVVGFDLSTPVAEAMWRKYTGVPGHNIGGELQCDALGQDPGFIGPPAPGGPYLTAADVRNDEVGTRARVSEYHRSVYGLARRIGRAKQLGQFLQMSRVVSQLTGAGSRDALASRYATDLIHQVARTNDIEARYRQNLDSLNKFVASDLKEDAGTTGRGFTTFTEDRSTYGPAGKVDGATGGS